MFDCNPVILSWLNPYKPAKIYADTMRKKKISKKTNWLESVMQPINLIGFSFFLTTNFLNIKLM